MAGFRTDPQIKSLDRTDICELFPGKWNLKLRKDITEVIHPKVKQHANWELVKLAEQRLVPALTNRISLFQRPVDDLVRELKDFIPPESEIGVCSLLTYILHLKWSAWSVCLHLLQPTAASWVVTCASWRRWRLRWILCRTSSLLTSASWKSWATIGHAGRLTRCQVLFFQEHYLFKVLVCRTHHDVVLILNAFNPHNVSISACLQPLTVASVVWSNTLVTLIVFQMQRLRTPLLQKPQTGGLYQKSKVDHTESELSLFSVWILQLAPVYTSKCLPSAAYFVIWFSPFG